MLTLSWTSEAPAAVGDQLLAVVVRDVPNPDAFDGAFGKPVREAFTAARFGGKPGDTFSFTRTVGDVLERVVLVGVGDLADPAAMRTLGHDLVRLGHAAGVSRLAVDLRSFAGIGAWGDATAAVRSGNLFAQGCELGGYAYERFVAEDKRSRRSVREVVVVADSTAPAEGSGRGQIIASSIARARDLVNGPAGLVTPTHLAETAKEIVASLQGDHDVQLTVLDRDACAARQMGCFLGVAQGSDEPPKFIHLSYKPKGASKGRVCLIGKGVTFDSGGYSIKPTDGMLDMKMDMAGAAAVIAAFEGAVRLGVPWEVHSIVAATENMVSGHAYRLGDILTASNGRTVEINNTDAEGRLTLADAMVYASKLEPTMMLDFATLTGACMVALGPKIAGVMSKDDRLADDWIAAAGRVGEAMWRLPLPDDLKEQLKSKIADMKNTGERYGGAITAGLFLSEFTEGCRWLHCDIAGPAMASKPYGVTTAGGSGVPVATILEFLG
ncbi:MAG: leucyl aminopeptidase [Deltaproteobacteria bacterium]|nr:leucyl aminopeptidase [Deltaproteobacteria bacterium]MBK8713131.1 leucyl aminopeptidase [Deltaproteobacteria bacterium]MBP7286709.1 leucyl aminopeptidase [Nannocystaceae bacterium]